MAEEDFSELEKRICDVFKINQLTVQQKTAIQGVLDGNDVFMGTKTGSGKSLVYESVPILFGGGCCVVIAPLLSIMKEQCERLNSLNFRATYIGRDHKEDKGIKNGIFNFVFASPEMLLGEAGWKQMFLTEHFRKALKLLVVDGAHTVMQW